MGALLAGFTYHMGTRMRRLRAALRLSQAYFSNIVELSEDGIISVDAEQCITLFNLGAEKVFGYRAHEVLGQPLDVLIPRGFTRTTASTCSASPPPRTPSAP